MCTVMDARTTFCHCYVYKCAQCTKRTEVTGEFPSSAFVSVLGLGGYDTVGSLSSCFLDFNDPLRIEGKELDDKLFVTEEIKEEIVDILLDLVAPKPPLLPPPPPPPPLPRGVMEGNETFLLVKEISMNKSSSSKITNSSSRLHTLSSVSLL